MGLFSVFKMEGKCWVCGNSVLLRIQFKYGSTRLNEYELGDSLIWGPNDEEEPGHKRVVVDAAAEHCPVCNAEGEDYEVRLEHDRIVAVKPSSGKYDYRIKHQPYIILEE